MSAAALCLCELASNRRLSAFETSTPEGRAKERYRRVTLTGLAAVLAKIIAVSTGLVAIPAGLHCRAVERFGL